MFAHPDDLSWLTNECLDAFSHAQLPCSAWVFLPNHYHVLLETQDIRIVSETLRLLHSRVATTINGRQNQRGRQVWYRFTDRLIRNERHYWATINYIHYNPVKHKYVDRMSEWPWSSFHEYLEIYGEEWLIRTWNAYPVGNYGKGWDW
ncbi:MAG: REP-associated tyrosine transposase [Anaerolineae bacterium]